MKICLNSDELHALYGLPHAVICLYILAIRPRMDFKTGMVGVRPLISWHALTEWVYVDLVPGVHQDQMSVQAIRRAARRLQEAGLLRIASNVAKRQLIFECIFASRDKSVQNQADRSATRQADRPTAAPALGNGAQADRPKTGQADKHPNTIKTSTSITTTTTGNSFSGGGANGKNEAPPLIWPRQLSDLERAHAGYALEGLPGTDAQLVLDEYAGKLPGAVKNPVQYIGRLARLARAGQFIPELAHQVRENRERSAASAAAVAVARAQYLAGVERQTTRPMTDAEISQLPESISRTLRRKRG